MATTSQLYLLCDHIKLSLLERQRAISLNLPSNSGDRELSNSLEDLRDGIDVLDHAEALTLRKQYEELYHQFSGSAPAPPATLTKPNDPSLAGDFAKAQSMRPRSSSFRRNNNRTPSKSVRFSDNPLEEDEANRAALIPYKDEPDEMPDHSDLDNQQIHEYHSQVIREQDTQLDQLSISVRRTGELSIQIGDELDEQNGMLGEVDEYVDRHQTQLDRAKGRLNRFAKAAKEGGNWTVIAVLTIILVTLLVVLK
jgi:syntaxin 8